MSGRRRRANVAPATHEMSTTPRRRNVPPTIPSDGIPRTKEINVGPMLESGSPGIKLDSNMTVARAIALVGIMIHSAWPSIISWGMIVFALEAIVKEEPESGLLITFTQFLFTAMFTLPSHFSISHAPRFLKPTAIPVIRWIPNVGLFFAVNLLNNYAFGFNISVPVHIILRSGGSVTTLLVGWLWGKRYNRVQVFSVAVLTVGVVIAAMSDAQAKGKTGSSTTEPTASFMAGLLILFLAQILSAIMGLYTQTTYQRYGPHWHENLFYSHFLSLPLFLPFFPTLYAQFLNLLDSQPLSMDMLLPWLPFSQQQQTTSWFDAFSKASDLVPRSAGSKVSDGNRVAIPAHLLTLALNGLTQYACIRGVNLLSARTSALGVTVVLNIRKLISLFASIWLFSNELPVGVLAGAAVVFLGGGIYAWDGSRPERRPLRGRENGDAEKRQ